MANIIQFNGIIDQTSQCQNHYSVNIDIRNEVLKQVKKAQRA